MTIPAMSNALLKSDRVSITAGHVYTATNTIKLTMSNAVSFALGLIPANDRLGSIIDFAEAADWAS